MVPKGIKTYGSFAFFSDYNPMTGTGAQLDTEITIPILGSADHELRPYLRRLHWESYHNFMNDFKDRLNAPDEETRPVRLPAPERADRMAAFRAKHTGLNFEGELEPSIMLIDKLTTIRASGVLRPIRWDELTKRSAELKGGREGKTEEMFKKDSNGLLRCTVVEKEDPADTGSEMKLHNALRRRGYALELAGLMSWDHHEKIISLFWEKLNAEPVKDFHRVSLDQV